MASQSAKKIISAISSLPLWQCYFAFGLAIFGIFISIGGFYILQNTPAQQEFLKNIPGSVCLIAMGIASFCVFFSLPFVIILSKMIVALDNEVSELKKEVKELKG